MTDPANFIVIRVCSGDKGAIDWTEQLSEVTFTKLLVGQWLARRILVKSYPHKVVPTAIVPVFSDSQVVPIPTS